MHEISSLKRIGSQIKAIRLAKHMTQHELAIASDIDDAVIYRIETGMTVPNLKTVGRLAVGLSCHVTISFNSLEEGDITNNHE